MTVTQAREKIVGALEELAAPIREAGFTVETRIIYADKTLREYSEFDTKSIIIYGDMAVGNEELERDEYCNFSMCCEIKTGLVDDEEFMKELCSLEGEVEAFKEKLEKNDGKTATEIVKEINAKQEEEAERAAIDFSKQLNKVRIKLLIGIGVIVVIILAIIVGIPMLTR